MPHIRALSAIQSNALSVHHTQNARRTLQPPIQNGTTVFFISCMDKSTVTVHPNGDVTTEEFQNIPEQKWTVVTHPKDSNALEFKQKVTPYNMLSGYENPPEVYPRPLGLSHQGAIEENSTWHIRIRGRWCIQANGYGRPMDMDDCEDFYASWQHWQLEIAS